MNDAVSVGAADRGDVPRLLALSDKFRSETGNSSGGINPDRVERDIFGSSPRLHVAVARSGAEIAGYLSAQDHFDAASGLDGLFVCDLFVDPPYRRAKVASALFEHAIGLARARDLSFMLWYSDPANESANAFYASVGSRSRIVRANVIAIAKRR